MRVPDNAGSGEAKITVSFPDWKEETITPATFDVLIEKPTVKGHPLPIKPISKTAERKGP